MYLFDYLGGFYFWTYLSTIAIIKQQPTPKFEDVLRGTNRYKEEDPIDLGAYGLKLKFIGFVVTMLIVSLLTQIRW